jgi:hypothetical protein
MLPWLQELEVLKTQIGDAIRTISRDMLAHMWEKVEFQSDVLHMTQGPHVELY